ncbi:hypothetical protein ABT033_31130 [Streptomyces pharetrae]|uniref:hypothetical protein n=1 Tax=Streptomyces pharetrae TaxID=291370 RepID=UPI00334C02DB
MTLFANVHESPSGGDWMSDEVRDRLAAPLDDVPSIDPTDADMDVLLAELKASGKVLRTALRDAVAASESEEDSVTCLPKRARNSTSTYDTAWTEFILRWAEGYRQAAQEWFFPARRDGWSWPQRHSGFDFIFPLRASTGGLTSKSSGEVTGSAYLTLHMGSGKTVSTISLIERLARKRRVFERQHKIDYIARLSDNWSACTCKHGDIEPALNIAWPGDDGGLLVMLIDFDVAVVSTDPTRPLRRARAPRAQALPALRRRRDRTLAKAAAPPAPSAVLVVDTSQIQDRPTGVPAGGGLGIYVPLPRHLTPASEHAGEVQEWWHAALAACASKMKGDTAI